MPKLHNVPAKEVHSEWVQVRSGFTWERLSLTACENGGLYFHRGWEPDAILFVRIDQIIEIVELDNNSRNRAHRRVQIAFPAGSNRSLATKLFEGFKVSFRTLPSFFLMKLLIFTPFPPSSKKRGCSSSSARQPPPIPGWPSSAASPAQWPRAATARLSARTTPTASPWPAPSNPLRYPKPRSRRPCSCAPPPPLSRPLSSRPWRARPVARRSRTTTTPSRRRACWPPSTPHRRPPHGPTPAATSLY